MGYFLVNKTVIVLMLLFPKSFDPIILVRMTHDSTYNATAHVYKLFYFQSSEYASESFNNVLVFFPLNMRTRTE